MKIAITSASGQLGSTIVNELKSSIGAENVIGVVRTPEKAQHLGVEIRKGDYNSREEFENALKGMDAVMILSGNDQPEKRIQQHRNIIKAAKSNGLKKIVYTSIVGAEKDNAFSPIVQSNRQTEEDVRNSGLEWTIGRNGIYIEPDLEYLDHYVKAGEISNCAAEGKCTYTSRKELAYAYSKMLLEEKHNGQTYNLVGHGITQGELANLINEAFGTNLIFRSVSVEEYLAERKAELGDFLGTVIAGIYEGIRNGANDIPSDYKKASGRAHKSPIELMHEFQQSN